MLIGKSTDKRENFDFLICYFGNLESATIPSFIEIISPYAFKDGDKIKRIEFPDDSKLRIIPEKLFSDTSIESIKIPSSVKQIENHAFNRMSSLSTVIIESDSKLESIGKYAFLSTDIKAITIPSHLSIIGYKAFKHCNNLKEVNFLPCSNCLTIEEMAFSMTNIDSFTVPSSQLTIKHGIFLHSPIKSFSILNTEFNDLQNGWCCNCSNLTNIEVNPNNPYLKMYEKNLLIGKSSKDKENFDVLHLCLRNVPKSNINIPNYIEIINICAIYACKNIKSIVFEPNSKTKIIHYEGIAWNRNLKIVAFPENSELQEINDHAFINTNVQSFYFPHKIRKIGNQVFSNIKIFEFADNSDLEYNELKFCEEYEDLIIMMPPKMGERIFSDKTLD